MEEGPPSSLSALSSKPAFLIVLGCITVNGISSFHIWKYITNAKRYTQVLVQHLVHGTILLSQKFQKCSPQFPDLYRLVDQNRQQFLQMCSWMHHHQFSHGVASKPLCSGQEVSPREIKSCLPINTGHYPWWLTVTSSVQSLILLLREVC